MEAGEVIQGRYELGELLGRGGMAEVWRASDAHLARSAAVKFLAPELSDDPEFLVRFFSEAQAVARLSHPNVVQVLDFGEHEGTPYLVMEAVEGGTVTDLTGQPVEVAHAFAIVGAAAHGAGAAHEQGIVHRDIKPGNILLNEEGEAKLADFGIAASARSERLTGTGTAIGSPHYISPEQASGGNATPASDVYALGIVLYELLTGVRPFDGENVTAIAIAHVEQEPVPPSTRVPGLGGAVDAVVLRCLAKNPSDRYADGKELAAALESSEVGRPAVVATPVIAETARWASRRALVGVGIAALLLTAAVVGVLVSNAPPPASADDEGGERLPNVGGLDIKRSPSPEEDGQIAAPRPSPTRSKDAAKEKTAGGDSDSRSQDRDQDSEEESEEESDPEPTPEATEPEPEPTSESTPDP